LDHRKKILSFTRLKDRRIWSIIFYISVIQQFNDYLLVLLVVWCTAWQTIILFGNNTRLNSHIQCLSTHLIMHIFQLRLAKKVTTKYFLQDSILHLESIIITTGNYHLSQHSFFFNLNYIFMLGFFFSTARHQRWSQLYEPLKGKLTTWVIID
jgi:hypothetical protein